MRFEQIKRGLAHEAEFLRAEKLTYPLLLIHAGLSKGMRSEVKELGRLRRTLGRRFYPEAVYVLTHHIVENRQEAESLWEAFIKHRKAMSGKLGREVSLQVAALDYVEVHMDIPRQFTVIGTEKLKKMATDVAMDQGTGTLDKRILSMDLKNAIEKYHRSEDPVSVLFLKLGEMEKFGAEMGQKAYDRVMKVTAENIKKLLGKGSNIYRYRPDGFVVLPKIGHPRHARDLAKEIIGEMKRIRDKTLKDLPSISIGVASMGESGVSSRGELMSLVEKASNLASKEGYDKVCVSGDSDIGQDKKRQGSHKTVIETNRLLEGVSLAPGLAQGYAFFYRDIQTRGLEIRDLGEDDVQDELIRLDDALDHVRAHIELLKKSVRKSLDADHAMVFEMQKAILDDPDLLKELRDELLVRRINAEEIVRAVFLRRENQFRHSEKEIVRQRADDINDLYNKVIKVLIGVESNILERLPPESVVFAQRLLPSDTVHLNEANVRGIVTCEGGPTSHAAILSKSMSVPLISHVKASMDEIPTGMPTLVDGDKGTVVLNPSKTRREQFSRKIKAYAAKAKEAVELAKKVPQRVVYRGQEVSVFVNAASAKEIRTAETYRADGIGLLRLEAVYMTANSIPEEDSLCHALVDMLEPMREKPIVYRLLDLGGDKQLPYLKLSKDEQSALGLRGIRLLLEHPKFLEGQLRVFMRLQRDYPLRLLAPMITVVEELHELKAHVKRVAAEMKISGGERLEGISIGAMIETPSAVLSIEEIAAESDFLSIGTNDLVQYTLAIGRESSAFQRYQGAGRELVMKSLFQIVKAADRAGIPCELCGELAGDLDYTAKLLDIGLRQFSVAPHIVPHLKQHISRLNV